MNNIFEKEWDEVTKEDLEEIYPRVFKLIEAEKNFIVIATHEPYFKKVYRMIRRQERKQRTWTFVDELLFKETMKQRHCSRKSKEVKNG